MTLIGRTRCAVACIAVLMACSAAHSGPIITKDLDPAKFGGLAQGATNSPALGCGPTSAVNSFTFLQNTYPDWYQGRLIPTTPVALANLLMTEPYMGTPAGVGTTITRFVTGKQNYLNAPGPNALPYTIMQAMVSGWSSGVPVPSYVDVHTPTLDFLLGQLNSRADIELLILFPLHGHYVTVTGMTWDTITDDGTVRYIDPTDGSPHSMGFSRDTSGTITVFYTDPSNGQTSTGIVHSIVSEVPTPSGAVVLLLGLWPRRRRPGARCTGVPLWASPCRRPLWPVPGPATMSGWQWLAPGNVGDAGLLWQSSLVRWRSFGVRAARPAFCT